MRQCTLICITFFFLLNLSFGQAPFASTPEPGKMSQYQFSDWFFHHNAGWKALALNKLTKAEYCFNHAIEIAKIEVDTDPRLAARSYGDLAWVLHREGRDAEAQPLATWALAVREKSFGPGSMQATQTMYTLATIELKLNHVDAAEDLLTKILANCRANLGPRTTGTAEAMEDLAGLYMIKRDYLKARILYKQALGIRTASDPDNPEQIYSLDGLSTIELAEGKLYEAERHLADIILLIPQSRSFDAVFASKIYLREAEIYRQTGRTELADKSEATAKAVLNSPLRLNKQNRADVPRYQTIPLNPTQPGLRVR